MQDNNPAYESSRNPNQIEDYDYMWNRYMGQKRPFESAHILVPTHLHIKKPVDMTLLALIRPSIYMYIQKYFVLLLLCVLLYTLK